MRIELDYLAENDDEPRCCGGHQKAVHDPMNGMRILLPIDPQAVVNALFARDQASHTLGMQLAAAAPGYVRVTMTVRPDMLNGLGACHGGFIFTLADSAFALACNSYNQNTVASGCIIDFLAPGRLGELLTAEAVEQSLSGRVGVYDITVTNQNGRRIALFRGRSYRINGEVIDATALPTPLDG